MTLRTLRMLGRDQRRRWKRRRVEGREGDPLLGTLPASASTPLSATLSTPGPPPGLSSSPAPRTPEVARSLNLQKYHTPKKKKKKKSIHDCHINAQKVFFNTS